MRQYRKADAVPVVERAVAMHRAIYAPESPALAKALEVRTAALGGAGVLPTSRGRAAARIAAQGAGRRRSD